MATETIRAGQLILDSTTPPPDRGFYKIDDTTTGHVGKLVINDPTTNAASTVITATSSAQGLWSLGEGGRIYARESLLGGNTASPSGIITGSTAELNLGYAVLKAGAIQPFDELHVRAFVEVVNVSGANKIIRLRLGGETPQTVGTQIAIATHSTNQSLIHDFVIFVGADLNGNHLAHVSPTASVHASAPIVFAADFSRDLPVWLNGVLSNAADTVKLHNFKILRFGNPES
jgi:hypothetical protein